MLLGADQTPPGGPGGTSTVDIPGFPLNNGNQPVAGGTELASVDIPGGVKDAPIMVNGVVQFFDFELP